MSAKMTNRFIGTGRTLVGLGLTGALVGLAQAGSVVINEVRIDQEGGDDDEYFELRGAPNGGLDDLSYITLGDGAAILGSGVVENVTDLDGLLLNASGYFVAAESTFSLGTPDLTTSLSFENSDNVTHMLVRNFTGAAGDDLDIDDDGVLDVTPWDEIVDLIAIIEEQNPPESTEFHYGGPTIGPEVLPFGSVAPGHVYRCSPSDEWRVGCFMFDDDTPGIVNEECPLCPGDFDESGEVAFADLTAMLNNWGACPGGLCGSCPWNVDGNGSVSFADLTILLNNWGPCD